MVEGKSSIGYSQWRKGLHSFIKSKEPPLMSPRLDFLFIWELPVLASYWPFWLPLQFFL